MNLFYGGDGNALERVINWGERIKKQLYQFNHKHFRPIFIIDQAHSDEVADSNLSPRLQVKQKRKSESELMEVHPEEDHLQRNKLGIVRKIEDEKHNEDTSA